MKQYIRNGLPGGIKIRNRCVCVRRTALWMNPIVGVDMTEPALFLYSVFSLLCLPTSWMHIGKRSLYLLTLLVLLDQYSILESILNHYKTFHLTATLLPYSVKSSYNIRLTRAKFCERCSTSAKAEHCCYWLIGS